jgi:aryl-phospho-beta-D-glucosidase BglC (GH1 family)
LNAKDASAEGGKYMKRWQGYEHGINLGGWLSQCDHTKERYENFINEDDIRRIREWGLDHVRLPVDYEAVDAGMEYIDRAAEWCGRYDLNMIIDLHKTYGYSFDGGEGESGFFDSEELQERFYGLWEKLAARYAGLGDRVAFELLNEVTDKEYGPVWNRISTECIRRLRKIAPDTKIIIGGYYNNSIEAIRDIAMPCDDNVVYTFHCYEPLIFTHQGAPWAPGMKTDFRISINASYAEMTEMSKKYLSQVTVGFDGFDDSESLSVAFFDRLFAEAVKVAEERNVALYCGEYGVIDLADAGETLKWYQIISEAFDKYRIGRSAWSYKEMNFGFTSDHMKPVIDQIIKKL